MFKYFNLRFTNFPSRHSNAIKSFKAPLCRTFDPNRPLEKDYLMGTSRWNSICDDYLSFISRFFWVFYWFILYSLYFFYRATFPDALLDQRSWVDCGLLFIHRERHAQQIPVVNAPASGIRVRRIKFAFRRKGKRTLRCSALDAHFHK